MYIARSLDEIPPLQGPIALTIGNFDGVHAGHQCLLTHLRTLGTPVVFTFSNHPRELLTGEKIPLLSPLESRLALLEKAGVALTILLPFTREFASQSYTTFLTTLHSALPFTHLLLGEDAALGHNREGTPTRLTQLGTTCGFTAHFLPKLTKDGAPISSTSLRSSRKV